MNTEFINKLLAAGFDVQTQNQGTVVTVSYTQVGPSFDSNLKEIENQFKLFNDGNNPVDFYSDATSAIEEMRANPALVKVIQDHARGAMVNDCGDIATLISAGVEAKRTVTINSWDWFIAGVEDYYRLTINPDSVISNDQMQLVRDNIKTQLGDRWMVVLGSRVHGIDIFKPRNVVKYFTNLIDTLSDTSNQSPLCFTFLGVDWLIHRGPARYIFQPKGMVSPEDAATVYAIIERELVQDGQYLFQLAEYGPWITVLKNIKSDTLDFYKELDLIFHTSFVGPQVIVIDGQGWSISGSDGNYQLTINPDSDMTDSEMMLMHAKIETGMVGWDVRISSGSDGRPGFVVARRGDSNEIN